LEGRLAAKKATLVSLETAYDNAVSNYASHSLDTGQTRQSITTHSINQMRVAIERLENDIVALENRLNGCAVVQGRPDW